MIPYKRENPWGVLLILLIVIHFELIQTWKDWKDFGACSILSPVALYVTCSPVCTPPGLITLGFDIDTVQAQSGLQRQKRGMQIPQSPFLLQAQGTQTLPKDCTLQRALLST